MTQTKKQEKTLSKTYREIFGLPPTKEEADRIEELLGRKKGRMPKGKGADEDSLLDA